MENTSLILKKPTEQVTKEEEKNHPPSIEKDEKENEIELNSLTKGSLKKCVEIVLRLIVKYHNQNEPMLMRIR